MHQSTAPSLLNIPCEIRVMIYKLLEYQTRPITRQKFWRNYTLSRASPHPTLGLETLRTQGLEAMLLTLRSTCRQLHNEILHYFSFSYPEISLDFADSLHAIQTKELIPQAIDAFTGYRVIQDNLVKATFEFGCDLKKSLCYHRDPFTDSYHHRPVADALHSLSLRRLFPGRVTSTSRHLRIDGKPYRDLIAALQECPRLKQVYIVVAHGHLLDWWPNPTQDFAPWAPLLRRDVVVYMKVRFVLWGYAINAYSTVTETLSRGYGEVVMKQGRCEGVDAGQLYIRQRN